MSEQQKQKLHEELMREMDEHHEKFMREMDDFEKKMDDDFRRINHLSADTDIHQILAGVQDVGSQKN